MNISKKRVLIIAVIIIAIAIPLITLIYNNKYTEKIEIDLRFNYGACNTRQTDMSNYVIEHYDDIRNYCNEVILGFEDLTHTDIHGRIVMEQNTYENLLNKYGLSHFCDLGYVNFYDNQILFVFDTLEFDNGCYAGFSFVFEGNEVYIEPYVYDLLHKDGY